jgi:hypothetical protein
VLISGTFLASYPVMITYGITRPIIVVVLTSLFNWPFLYGQSAVQSPISRRQKELVAGFESRVKQYVELREKLEERLPKLPKDATAEQIESHKRNFMNLVREARRGARKGDIFTPQAINFIRAAVRAEFKGRERKELLEQLSEADQKGIPLQVNHPYPSDKELVEMPPTLLLRLPQLPKQIRYRFVGRNLLLVDRENGLIVDYMQDALF